jgi:hypothetical protein
MERHYPIETLHSDGAPTCVRFSGGALTLVACTDDAAQRGFKLVQ